MGMQCQGARAAALQEQRQAQAHLQACHCDGGLGKVVSSGDRNLQCTSALFFGSFGKLTGIPIFDRIAMSASDHARVHNVLYRWRNSILDYFEAEEGSCSECRLATFT